MRDYLRKLVQHHPFLHPWSKYFEEGYDWSGAKNFFLALFLLGIALVISLNGADAFEHGRTKFGAFLQIVALGLAFYVSVRLVPAMARTTPLRWFFYQVDYKFTRGGVVYVAATFIIALAGLNTGNNLLFLVVASLLAGILVSGVVSRIVLTGIGLRLELPDHVFARQPVMASLTLENHKMTLPSFSLTVRGEASANGKKGAARSKPAPGKALPRVLSEPVYFPYIPRYKHSTQQVELTFPRRGRYAQDVFQVSSKFPFGFLLKTRQLPSASEVVVYPPVQPTEEFYEILPLISGEMESYYKGRGHDLYSIRDHQPSDGARYVDWKATAKAQAVKVREFTREDERRVELVFDPFLPPEAQGPDWEERFERGVNFCACLAWHFFEIDAQMKFRSPTLETAVAPAAQTIYDVLYNLALIEPGRGGEADLLPLLAQETNTFKIILTARPRGSIPTGLWTSSYFVFLQSL